jgi:hypothetical protein
VPGGAPVVDVSEVVDEPEVPGRRAAMTGPRRTVSRWPARRPVKPAGRGPLFWVLVAVSGTVLLLGLAFAGVYFAVWMPRWREHESVDGYRAEFPATLRGDMRDRLADPRPGTVEGTLLALHRETFLVRSAHTLGPRPGVGPDALTQEAVDALLIAFPGAVVIRTDPIGVSEFPGREVVLEGPDRWGVVARVVVAETRTYTVVVVGPGVTPDGPRVRRFLDSFRITTQELYTKRAQRLETERRVAEAVAAERHQREEAKRQEDARLAAENRKHDEVEAKERAFATSVEKAREDFRSAGRPAPDPYLIPGLVLHLGFDGPDPMWPKSAGKLTVSPGAAPGPGPRGTALYLTPKGHVTLDEPSRELKAVLEGPLTIAGWVKLRFRPVTIFQVHDRRGLTPVGHLTAGGRRLVFNSRYRYDAWQDEEINSQESEGRVRPQWGHGGQWRHIAVVRERRGAGERVLVYLDGQVVTDAAAPPWSWSDTSRLTFAAAAPTTEKAWPGPIGPVNKFGNVMGPEDTEVVCAADEICLYDRPLTAAEVRVLAGVDKVPADIAKKERPAAPVAEVAEPIVLTPAAESLPPLVGIAFDPARKTAWAVTARRPAELIRLSYPEMVEQGRYRLPGRAGPVAFDAPENALFVAVRADGGFEPIEPDGWPAAGGAIHRYNLADLPVPVPGAPPAITPGAETALPGMDPVTALAVDPSGEWLCAIRKNTSGRGYAEGRTLRLPLHLQGADKYLAPPPSTFDRTGFPYRLGVPEYGSAVWFPAERDGSKPAPGEWSRIDLRTGRSAGRVSFGSDLPLGFGRSHDWAIHPDGDRLFLPFKGNLIEVRPVLAGRPAEGQRLLIPAIKAESRAVRLGLTADGRYLFCAVPEDRLTVVETDPAAARPLSATLMGEQNAYSVPFWVAPDGAVVVFLSGRVVRVNYPAGRAPRSVTRAERLAVAPLPRRVGHTAAPTDIPGLTFYLPLDDRDGDGVREVVSGKTVGKLFDAEFVDGVRGRAARLRADVKSAGSAGLDLKDQLGAVRFAANQPFTICVWMRAVEGNGGSAFFATRKVGKVGEAYLGASVSLIPKPDPMLSALIRERSDDPKSQVTYAGENRYVKERHVWRHVAIIRDAAGQVRVAWDGVTSSARPFAIAMEYDTFGLGTGAYQDGIDVDEFCIFNRALSDDEVRKLAGVP